MVKAIHFFNRIVIRENKRRCVMLPLCDLLVVSIEFCKVNQIRHVEVVKLIVVILSWTVFLS
jgi:hypothetical protein